jgi:hypothetical protein
MKAAQRRNAVAVQSLLLSGADVTARDANGFDSLWWAAMAGDEQCTELILQEMVRIQCPLWPEASHYLEAAAYGGNHTIVALILQTFPTMGATTLRRAAMIASTTGKLGVLRCLYEAGVRLNDNFAQWFWPQVAKLEDFDWRDNSPVPRQTISMINFQLPDGRTTIDIADEYVAKMMKVLGHVKSDARRASSFMELEDDVAAAIRIVLKSQETHALAILKAVWGARLASIKAFFPPAPSPFLEYSNFERTVKKNVRTMVWKLSQNYEILLIL